MRRVVAGLLAIPVLAFAAWGSLYVLLLGAMAAQRPDPLVPDGDPCCAHPDTWGEVASWSAWTLVWSLALGAVLAAGVALAARATRGRFPRPRSLALVSAAVVAVTAVAMSAGLALSA